MTGPPMHAGVRKRKRGRLIGRKGWGRTAIAADGAGFGGGGTPLFARVTDSRDKARSHTLQTDDRLEAGERSQRLPYFLLAASTRVDASLEALLMQPKRQQVPK